MKFKNLCAIVSFAMCTPTIYSMGQLEEITDPVQMIDKIRAEVDTNCPNCSKSRAPFDFRTAAVRKFNETHLDVIASLCVRYYIVGQLDASCCSYEGTRDCFKRTVNEAPLFREIVSRMDTKKLTDILEKQYAWVEEKVEKNKLNHSLRYIQGYSWDSWGEPSVDRPILLPKEQWQERRQGTLAELKGEFGIE